MFYSFQDVGFAFGWSNVETQLVKEISSKTRYKIEQRRSITGSLKIRDSSTCRLNKWRIRDLSGWTNTSLKQFAISLGISMENKDLLDDFKENMNVALLEQTKIFLDYALDDVIVLREILSRFLNFVNEVLQSTLDLPSRLLFTKTTIPFTTGSLVTETFERYILYSAQKNSQLIYYKHLKGIKKEDLPERSLGSNSLFYLALWSLSFIKKNHGKKEEYLSIYKEIFQTGDLKTIVDTSLKHGEQLAKWAFSSPFENLPYSEASIKTIASVDLRTTLLLNGLVSGGRANNELPSEY
jgi:hypothetical protein